MLSQLVAYLQRKKKTPNLTNLVTNGMPHGRGLACHMAVATRVVLHLNHRSIQVNLSLLTEYHRMQQWTRLKLMPLPPCLHLLLLRLFMDCLPYICHLTYSPLPPHTPSMMTPPSPAAYPSSSFMSSPATHTQPTILDLITHTWRQTYSWFALFLVPFLFVLGLKTDTWRPGSHHRTYASVTRNGVHSHHAENRMRRRDLAMCITIVIHNVCGSLAWLYSVNTGHKWN